MPIKSILTDTDKAGINSAIEFLKTLPPTLDVRIIKLSLELIGKPEITKEEYIKI